MNKEQIDFLLKNYPTRSVKELAAILRADPKEIRKELRRIFSAPQKEKEREAPQPFSFGGHLLTLGLVLAVVFLVYSKGLTFPFLNWDDPKYVKENPLIRTLSLAHLKEMFTKPYFSLYIPVSLLSYAFDYQVWHLNPWGYHLTNLLLHLGNAFLVYALIFAVTRERLLAGAVALLFGLHPVQIESVVWIAERKNVLSSLFFLASLLCYVFSRTRAQGRRFSFVLSLVFFSLACLAKPNVVVLPLLLWVFDLTHEAPKKLNLFRYLPFVIVAALFAWATFEITQGEGKMQYHGGSFSANLLLMTVAMMKYLELLFLPLRQSLIYEFRPYPSLFHPEVFFSFLGLLLVAAGLAYLLQKDRRLFFWGAWYFVLLLPVMNLIPFPSLMNDRYLYLPLIGAFTLMFLLLKKASGVRMAAALLVIAALGFTFLNLKRQEVWAHPERLWLETQKKTEQLVTAPYVNLGMHYLEAKEPEKAVGEFEKALAIRPGDADALNGLGMAYFGKGDSVKSVEYFKKAIESDPASAPSHSNLAKVYEAMKNFELALVELREAVTLERNQPIYRNNLGSVFEKLGREAEAEKEFLGTLEIDPDFPEALYNLGLLYSRRGNRTEAEKYWSRLLAIHPNHEKAEEIQLKLKNPPPPQ